MAAAAAVPVTKTRELSGVSLAEVLFRTSVAGEGSWTCLLARLLPIFSKWLQIWPSSSWRCAAKSVIDLLKSRKHHLGHWKPHALQKSWIQKRPMVETWQKWVWYLTFCGASLPHRLVLKLHFSRQLVDPRLNLAERDGNPVDTLFSAAVGVVGVVDQLFSHVLYLVSDL